MIRKTRNIGSSNYTSSCTWANLSAISEYNITFLTCLGQATQLEVIISVSQPIKWPGQVQHYVDVVGVFGINAISTGEVLEVVWAEL